MKEVKYSDKWALLKAIGVLIAGIPALVLTWFAIFGKIYKKNRRKND